MGKAHTMQMILMWNHKHWLCNGLKTRLNEVELICNCEHAFLHKNDWIFGLKIWFLMCDRKKFKIKIGLRVKK
jgi:hypothetical protein